MKRIVWTLIWILTATAVCSAQTTFYYPHVANGVLGGSTVWKTTIFLTNPSTSVSASGTITLTQDNSTASAAGSAFNISFTDESGATTSSNTIAFSIPAGGTKKFVSAGTGAYAGGFATVSTAAGTVNGTAIFSQFDAAGRLVAEAGVPAVSAVARQAIFVDTQGGYNIGVAYSNPGSSAASVQLSLINSAAVSVATTTVPLGPGNHRAAFTSEMFQGSGQLVGTMQLTSTTPLAAIALRFDPTFSVFTTLPPVTIGSLLSPAMHWLEQRPWLSPIGSLAKLISSFTLGLA